MPADNAIFDLLGPFLRPLLAVCVALVFVVGAVRIARRGRSRMRTAMLVSASAIVGLAVIGFLLGG